MKEKKNVAGTKSIKKTVSLLLTLLMLFSLFIIPISAAGEVYRANDTYIDGVIGENAVIINVQEWTGSAFIGEVYQTYCANHNILLNISIDMYLDALTNDNIRAILLNSYPNIDVVALGAASGVIGLTVAQAITGTQFAIWYYTDGFTGIPIDSNAALVYSYLISLSPVSATTPATASFINISSAILANGDAKIVITYPAFAAGTNSDGSPIPLALSHSIDLSVVYPNSKIVPTTDGVTNTETITIPVSDFYGAISFSVSLSGMQSIFDAFMFVKELDQVEITQNLVASKNIVESVSASAQIRIEVQYNPRTIGFWGNKNGERVINTIPDVWNVLRTLCLKDAKGKAFDPANFTQFKDWLRKANASNMQYMLSAQLAAAKLNSLSFVPSEVMLSVDPLIDVSGNISLGALIEAANNALCSLDADADRAMLGLYKNALDDFNNNLNFAHES